jgi:hypothetical protein
MEESEKKKPPRSAKTDAFDHIQAEYQLLAVAGKNVSMGTESESF